MKLFIRWLKFSLSFLPTSAPFPEISFNPAWVTRGSTPGLAWRWAKWALWHPIDWLLYEDYYASLIRDHMVFQFNLIGPTNEPPPSYRQLGEMVLRVVSPSSGRIVPGANILTAR